MKKKISTSIAFGLICASAFPMVVNATEVVDTTTEITKTDNGATVSNIENNAETIENQWVDTREWSKTHPALVNPDKKDMQVEVFSAETMVSLTNLIEKVDKFSLSRHNKEEYQAIMTELFEIYTNTSEEDRLLHNEYDQFSYIFFKLNYLAYTDLFENESEFNQFYQDLADNIYHYRLIDCNYDKRNSFITEFAKYLHSLAVYSESVVESDYIYFKDRKTFITLEYAYSKCVVLDKVIIAPNPDDESTHLPEVKPSEEPLPNEDGSGQLPDVDIDTDNTSPEIPDVNYSDNNSSEHNPDNIKYSEIEYFAVNNICYQKESIYNGYGELISSNITKMEGNDSSYCGIIDNIDFGLSPWGNVGEGGTYNGETALSIWNSLAQNDLNQLSNYTLQYSLNPKDEVPYYFDSGISVSNNMTATYTQVRDVLNQISIKANGTLIEDKDKLLFIAEGRPLVILNKQEEYSKDDISELLDCFENIDLKILEKSDGDSISLEEKIITNNANLITISDKDVQLSNSPKLKNSILQLPVKEVGEILGYKVDVNSETVTLTKDDIKIIMNINDKNVSINGETKITATIPTLENGVVYAEMNLIVKELNMSISYDKEKGSVSIK